MPHPARTLRPDLRHVARGDGVVLSLDVWADRGRPVLFAHGFGQTRGAWAESARRLAETLPAMLEVLGDRPAVMARELTKLHEEVRRGLLSQLAAHYAQSPAPKGEVTLLVGPPREAQTDSAAIDAALKAALPFMPVKAAAEMIAGLTDGSRTEIYARALDLKNE